MSASATLSYNHIISVIACVLAVISATTVPSVSFPPALAVNSLTVAIAAYIAWTNGSPGTVAGLLGIAAVVAGLLAYTTSQQAEIYTVDDGVSAGEIKQRTGAGPIAA